MRCSILGLGTLQVVLFLFTYRILHFGFRLVLAAVQNFRNFFILLGHLVFLGVLQLGHRLALRRCLVELGALGRRAARIQVHRFIEIHAGLRCASPFPFLVAAGEVLALGFGFFKSMAFLFQVALLKFNSVFVHVAPPFSRLVLHLFSVLAHFLLLF